MKRWFPGLMLLMPVAFLAACSSSGPTYALVGVPGQY